MIFNPLYQSSLKDELILINGGMCRYHLRNDGQITIYEIISTSKGMGTRMLRRLINMEGAKSIFAKCPVELESNQWYEKKGFVLEASDNSLNHWRYTIDTHQYQPVLHGIELIACLGGAGKVSEMSLDTGFLHGAQLPGKTAFRPYFVDQDWKKPDRQKYMKALEQYRPRLCTVLDLERRDQFSEVMDWAQEAAQFAGEIIVIPKVSGIVSQIPETISSKPVRLGYSVPSSYGASYIPLAEFEQRPVHLLGGNPDTQMELTRILNVKSADFNVFHKMSHRFCKYYAVINGKGKWQNLRDTDGEYGDYAHDEAFRRSVYNLMKAWRDFLSHELEPLPMPAGQLRLFND